MFVKNVGECNMGRRKKDAADTYNLSLLSGKQYSKSNSLINAKGKSSLMAQKLFAIGIQQAEEDESGALVSTIRGTDLRKIFGNSNGSFYDEIKSLVEPIKGRPSLLDWRVVFTDDTTKTLEAINVVTDCKFEDGIFNMSFNKKVKDQIWQLKSNYTIFSLTETIPLKSIYSFRMFEMLKAEYDRQEWLAKKNGSYQSGETYITDVNLTDLKLKLGIIDPSANEQIMKAVKKDSPDYDKIEELAQDQKDSIKYKRFSDFRAATIDVAQKELKEKTSISFDYEQLKSGRGGKTTAIRFFIHQNRKVEEKIVDSVIQEPIHELSEAEKYMVAFKTQTLLGTEYFSMENILSIVKAADYDMDKISQAHDLFLKSSAEIPNPTGWMIDAIKKGYQASRPKASRAANNAFQNFPQHQYDFELLEQQLLDN